VTAPSSRDRLPVVLAGACGVLAVVTGLMARTHDVAGAERSIGRWVYDLPDWSTPAWKAAMQAGVLGVSLLVALVLLLARRRAAGVAVLATSILTWTLCETLKAAVGRGRPTLELLGRMPRDQVTNNGWPSTHSAVSAALAAALLLALPLRGWPRAGLVALAVAAPLARVHLAVHWSLDVVGGAAIGVAVACVVRLGWRRFS
jgi:membrane-associated phospholipid phosphatase